MDIGSKIKLTRSIRGITQKELANLVGTHEVMIRKYEIGKAIPKDEQLKKIASALGVNANDVLPLLFAIDETFPVTIKEVDGVPGIFFNDKNLIQFLKDWQAMKELLAMGTQSEDNYKLWKTIRPGVTKISK